MIDVIIAALRARATSFGGRIAGAAEYKRLPETANLTVPAAYIIPMDDEAGGQESKNGYQQTVRDSFAVVVVLSNTPDERGQSSITSTLAIRAELWAALLAWAPDASHGPIVYEGGQLLDLDRARLYYQFEFSAETEILEEDTWQKTANAALGAFIDMNITVDAIDPFDPNRGATGPDGTAEAVVLVPVPQT